MNIEELIKTLSSRHLTVATAESCTGGLIAKLITDVPGASDVYMGGVVSYSNDVKSNVLGVDRDVLAAHGAVSEPVALAMADGARRVCGADIAVSTTGVAGPGGGSAEKPVGTVWVAVSSDNVRRAVKLSHPETWTREEIRESSARYALGLITDAAEAAAEKM